MSQELEQSVRPPVWQAQNLQLVTFPSDPQFAIEQDWWRDVMGVERESRSDKREERKEEGTFDGMSVTLFIDSSRLLWIFAPKTADDASDYPPVLGPFREYLERFGQLMRQWLLISPPVKRIGVSATLFQKVRDKDQGYRTLNRYLHNVQVETDSTDFLYRINRPAMVMTSGRPLKINRLTTWAFVTLTAIRARIGPMIQNPTLQVTNEALACILESDVNTAPESKLDDLSPAERVAVFDQLVETSLQISDQGIPGNV